MEKSKNYNFNLPNSENDEIADINDISDNFRIIDEIMNETDQTFEPTSTKAASGKAVNEAISGIQPIDENTEFIFDGGDVDGGVSVDIVVDTVLSKTSNNPIANKPVATKFSEILEAIDTLKNMVHIVESGTSGIWSYRKWSDGTAECWNDTKIDFTITWVDNSVTSYGGLPGGTSHLTTTLPFEFITGMSWWTGAGKIVIPMINFEISNSNVCEIQFAQSNTSTTATSVQGAIRVVGRWK